MDHAEGKRISTDRENSRVGLIENPHRFLVQKKLCLQVLDENFHKTACCPGLNIAILNAGLEASSVLISDLRPLSLGLCPFPIIEAANASLPGSGEALMHGGN